MVSVPLSDVAGRSTTWGYGKPRMNNAQAAARAVWESLSAAPAPPQRLSPDEVRRLAAKFCFPGERRTAKP